MCRGTVDGRRGRLITRQQVRCRQARFDVAQSCVGGVARVLLAVSSFPVSALSLEDPTRPIEPRRPLSFKSRTTFFERDWP
jgi:hypothetical protein